MAFNKARMLQEAENLVIQGKISQAIQRYFHIFERDPSELNLLNTIGDLYVRDRNVSEGLKQFHRLAEAYVQEGYTLKAIAIYKKIVKLEPDSVGPLLKLVELYQSQRLVREARELSYQVAEYYKKKKQNDKALETLRKVVQLDFENATARARLVAFCEEIGRKDEAARVYLEAAQLALRRGDTENARIALKEAQDLDPDNPQIQLLRAREALALKHPEEVEAILNSTPGLKDDPAGRSLLIDSYLAMRQPEKAQTLVLDHFRATPGDFSPLASFVSVCVQAGRFDAASRALSAVADKLIEQGNTSFLMESLRLIQSNSPQHLPTLELMLCICEGRGDGDTLPEILEALGQAYLQRGQFEKAEQSFQRLVDCEPANERYQALLRQVLQKEYEESSNVNVADLPSTATSSAQEERGTAQTASPSRDTDQEAMVKEALENSELFARYHLVSRAVAELERVLAIYPDQIEIHRRLVGLCWKDMPERAEQAAQALTRIYTQQGDAEGANRFAQMAGEGGAAAATTVSLPAVPAQAMRQEPLPPPPAQPAASTAGEIDLAPEFPLAPAQEEGTPPTPQASSTAPMWVTFEFPPPPEQEAPASTQGELPFDLSASPAVESVTKAAPEVTFDPSNSLAAQAPPLTASEMPLEHEIAPSEFPPAPSSEVQEIDLSEDLESFLTQTPASSPAPEAPPEAASFNYDDSRTEINFYLEHGFIEEARGAIRELTKTFPGDPRVIELRALVEAETGTMGEEIPETQPAETLEPSPLEAIAPPAEKELERQELISSCAVPRPEAEPAAVPLVSPHEEKITTESIPTVGVEAPTRLLGDLAEAFESAMGRLQEPIPLPASPSALAEGAASANGEVTPTESIPVVGVEASTHLLGDFAEAFESAIGRLEGSPPLFAPPSAPTLAPDATFGEEIPAESHHQLGDFTEASEHTTGRLQKSSPLPAFPSTPAAGPATRLAAPTPVPTPALSGPLEEVGESSGAEPFQQDDSEDHYNLGMAFWEMNLLDKAIEEFQEVVKGAGRRPHPTNYLQACTLLANCFMGKGMVPIAIKWYCRALEAPDLDEGAWLALQYDLGAAYERAGDLPRALEKYSEVYSQNIAFRDVAEKIRTFQQKGS